MSKNVNIKPDKSKESAEEAKEIEKPVEATGSKGSSPWAMVVALLALAGVMALTGALYLMMQKNLAAVDEMEKKLHAGNTERQQLITRIETLNLHLASVGERTEMQRKALMSYDQIFQAEKNRYEIGRREMLAAVNEMHRRLGRSTSRWMAAEAEYLIRVANHRLQFEADVKSALSALMGADERLRDTGDPLWVPVRKQIAEDISVLKTIKPIDRAGLSARLSAYSKQAQQLKIKTEILNHPQKMAKQAQQPSIFEQVLEDGWQGFKKLVEVRNHGKPVSAMLAPEQHFFLGLNVRLQIESARLALLQSDQALYDASLDTARGWLEQFFDYDDPGVVNLQSGLTDLARLVVAPDLPDISNALALMKKQAAMSQGAPVTAKSSPKPMVAPPPSPQAPAVPAPAKPVVEPQPLPPVEPAAAAAPAQSPVAKAAEPVVSEKPVTETEAVKPVVEKETLVYPASKADGEGAQ